MKKLLIFLLTLQILYPLSRIQGQDYQHFIIYGQSLSTGHQSYPVISDQAVDGNYMVGEQIWINNGNAVFDRFQPLKGTIAKSSQAQPKTRAGQAQAECPLLGMMNHLQLKTNGQFKYLATSSGTSGRTIEQLSKESQTTTHYNDFLKSLQYASQISKSIVCPAVVWMQGEYNYTGTGTGLTAGSTPTGDKNEYKSLLKRLKENMQSDVVASYGQTEKPLFLTYQTGVQYTRGKELSIGMAQLELSNELPDVVCAGPVYPMTDRGGHLDPNGYRWFGEMLAKVYYKTKILGQEFKPLQPKEISRELDGKTIRISFHVPTPPLVFDELTIEKITDYGFEVFDNNVKQSISNLSIAEDCVFITCSNPLSTGTLEIVYAGTNTSVKGHGNLRDSDNYQAYYPYLDLDKKVDGAYVFERDNTESTLRPNYEPHDNAGVIYDKPYPLYNFCVAFYYRLEAGQQKLSIITDNQTPGHIPVSYFVSKSGSLTGNGLSWESSITLEKALSLAVSKDTIHIAAGIYKPTKCVTGGDENDARDKTFEIGQNITLIGGYPADATTGAKANPDLYFTILDGSNSYQTSTEEKIATSTQLIGVITSSTSYSKTPGLEVNEIAYVSKQGYPMKIFALEIDLSNSNMDIEVCTPSNNPAFARQKLSVQAAYKEQSGKRVQMGINGDFFDPATGIPQGIVYKDGIAIKDNFMDANNTFFAITRSKGAIIGDQQMYQASKASVKEAIGGRAWLLKDGLTVNQKNTILDPRTCIGVSMNGERVFVLIVDGRNENYSNGMSYDELSACLKALGAYNAINLDGGGSTTLISRKIDGVLPDLFELKNSPSDGAEREVANGLLFISK